MKVIITILAILSIFVFDLSPAAQPGKTKNNNSASVETINKDKLSKIIKDRNGKALLLNVWATWCPPCRAEFPDLVKLGNDYKGKNLDIVGISVDDKKEVDSKLIPFLKENKANFKIYVNGFDKDEELIDFFDKKWQGEIPVTLVYDTKGNRTAFLIGGQDYNTFKKEVDAAMVE